MALPLLLWLLPTAALGMGVISRKRRFLVRPVKNGYIPLTGNIAFMAKRSDSHFHRGIDIGAPMGSPVYAAAQGVVVHAIRVPGTPGFRGYGKVIVVQHPNHLYTLYSHLSRVDTNVGDTVFPETMIGLVGDSCDTDDDANHKCSNTHLHFEISKRGYPQPSEAPRLDPTAYLTKEQGRFV
jgi:murein DD-endopeptidase MepM/ murein hydrolase activator NlpD